MTGFDRILCGILILGFGFALGAGLTHFGTPDVEPETDINGEIYHTGINGDDIPLSVLLDSTDRIQKTISRLHPLYDPNDSAYKFIPEAPAEWTDKFGVSERTRLLHSISELRVVVARLSKKVIELEKPVDVNDITE